jgi:hypothetical protein
MMKVYYGQNILLDLKYFEKIDNFIDKYSTIDQTNFKNKFHNAQMNMQKNMMTNFLISISQTTNEIYKNIIILK